MLAHRVMMGGRHAYADEVIADAPLAYWRLDETSGTTANDAIGSNHGTYTGGVTLNQPGIPSTGRPSVSLNGSSGYVNIPHHASLSITGDLTVEAWVYRSSAAGFRGVIAKRVGGNPCEFGLNFNQATPVTQWYFHDGTNFRMCSFAGCQRRTPGLTSSGLGRAACARSISMASRWLPPTSRHSRRRLPRAP